MNTFIFIGTIQKPKSKEDCIKTTSTGNKQLKLLIRENENNSAFVQMYGDTLIKGSIPVWLSNQAGRTTINFEDRFKENILNKISYSSKYIINDGDNEKQFIWKDDFMENAYELISSLPNNTKYEITGEFILSQYNNKTYYNFNIKRIKVNRIDRPVMKLTLDLFYNYKSLDEKDKKNKFILNAFIEQYAYSSKKREYFPLEVQFITNRFNFKNIADVEVIRHRKANMHPSPEEGYVKAKWEAQYVRGAQLILPPLETLPKDIQFEIENAGRDIKEYMSNVVGEATEFICLTRPDNTLNKEGKVYVPLNCSDKQFEENINEQFAKQLENNTLDRIAKQNAIDNPFN